MLRRNKRFTKRISPGVPGHQACPPAPWRPACLFISAPALVELDKKFAQKTNPALCEGMFLSTFNRTKMFHVKHFGTIELRKRTKTYSAGLNAISVGAKIPAAEGRISIWRLWNCARLARCPIETIVVP
jgi:hypothetical protein